MKFALACLVSALSLDASIAAAQGETASASVDAPSVREASIDDSSVRTYGKTYSTDHKTYSTGHTKEYSAGQKTSGRGHKTHHVRPVDKTHHKTHYKHFQPTYHNVHYYTVGCGYSCAAHGAKCGRGYHCQDYGYGNKRCGAYYGDRCYVKTHYKKTYRNQHKYYKHGHGRKAHAGHEKKHYY